MPGYLNIAQILVSIVLVVTIFFQLHGGGFGGIFGQTESVYRSRRGLEKTLFNLTIILAIVFVILAILIAKSPV